MQPPPLPPALPPPVQPPALPPQYPLAWYPSSDERTLGMLCHLLGIFTGFLGPLILWLVKKDSSPFVNHHGKEALNFQITVFLASICCAAVAVVLMVVMIGFIFIPVLLLISIGALVMKILACVSAQRGEWHRYPMCIKFIS